LRESEKAVDVGRVELVIKEILTAQDYRIALGLTLILRLAVVRSVMRVIIRGSVVNLSIVWELILIVLVL
jgi:hypothetical protein